MVARTRMCLALLDRPLARESGIAGIVIKIVTVAKRVAREHRWREWVVIAGHVRRAFLIARAGVRLALLDGTLAGVAGIARLMREAVIPAEGFAHDHRVIKGSVVAEDVDVAVAIRSGRMIPALLGDRLACVVRVAAIDLEIVAVTRGRTGVDVGVGGAEHAERSAGKSESA